MVPFLLAVILFWAVAFGLAMHENAHLRRDLGKCRDIFTRALRDDRGQR